MCAPGSGNIVLGNATGSAAANDQIILSTGSTGAVRAKWDSSGCVQLCVLPLGSVAPPDAGYLTLGYDDTKNQLTFQYRGTASQTVYSGACWTESGINTLTALGDAPTATQCCLVGHREHCSHQRCVRGLRCQYAQTTAGPTVTGRGGTVPGGWWLGTTST